MNAIRNDNVAKNLTLDYLIGQGSHGKLYTGYDKNGKKISIKIVDINKYKKDVLNEELSILIKLSFDDCNPGIICYKDIFIDEDDTNKLYMITEFIPNRKLSDTFHDLSLKFDEDVYYNIVLQFIKCLLDTVSYLHDKDIIHGDINPDNIYVCSRFKSVSSDGNVNLIEQYCPVLIDFSSACWNSKCLNKTKNHGVNYSAPEVIKSNKSFKQSDLWSLGLSLYTILFGTPDQINNLSSNINTPNTVLNYLLSTMLQYDHNKRGSAKQLYEFISHSSLMDFSIE